MKKAIALILISVFTFIGTNSFSHAEGDSYNQDSDYYTPNYEPRLEYKIDGNFVYFDWDKATNDEFRYYKLVHSESNKTPSYPENQTMFVGKIEQNENKVKYKKGYWRVCHVFKGYYEQKENVKYRSCSNVVYLSENKSTVSKDNNQIKKKYTTSKIITKTKLSQNLQKKANTVIFNFKKRLDKTGLSNESKVKKIDSIVSRLNIIAKSKPQLQELVMYLVKKLENTRSEYQDDFDGIEELFDF